MQDNIKYGVEEDAYEDVQGTGFICMKIVAGSC
jgi:hypothetical protein